MKERILYSIEGRFLLQSYHAALEIALYPHVIFKEIFQTSTFQIERARSPYDVTLFPQ